jgi:hypothetical protein
MEKGVMINGKRWYFTLLPNSENPRASLAENSETNFLDEKLVISMMKPNPHTDKPYRLFTNFNNYIDFFEYSSKLPDSQRTFFEFVDKGRYQKMRFDIEIENKDLTKDIELFNDVRSNTIKSLIEVLEELDAKIDLSRDVLVFVSHCSEFTKFSGHIVLDNYCCLNNLDAKELYNRTVSRMDENLSQYVDKAVYSSGQQFRIVGSQKLGSGRPKRFERRWDYFDKTIDYVFGEDYTNMKKIDLMILYSSLLTTTSHCKIISGIEAHPEEIYFKHHVKDNISEDLLHKSMVILAEHFGVKLSELPFKALKVVGGLICLKRLSPTKCEVCDRVHHAENPFMLVEERELIGTKQFYRVRFYCRRTAEGIILNEIVEDDPIIPDLPNPVNWMFDPVEDTSKIVSKNVLKKEEKIFEPVKHLGIKPFSGSSKPFLSKFK